MAGVPDPGDTLSWGQVAAAIFTFVAAVIAALAGKLKSEAPPKPRPIEADNIVLAGAAIADTKPIRELGAAVLALAEKNQRMAVAAERQAVALEAMAAHTERAANAQEAVAKAHDEMREMGERWIEKQEERYIRSLEGQLSAARKS
ncbi:hypothetical protein [Chelatococcus reniformis]|uniref:Uncharacterized protein n=1 Tax=Chelatococcus reniformis TaxID=1494448 RepID=A0A916UXK5_9HYPH|nr:hypothetical protein [Chelatococcus reniformis]GGC68746.1 hypothetical protein GCM10010994_29170 [Chelatococcus reniformis]GGC90164.1 hypothetical protein GCM10010994_55010 [Chelatococcus reniformis]